MLQHRREVTGVLSEVVALHHFSAALLSEPTAKVLISCQAAQRARQVLLIGRRVEQSFIFIPDKLWNSRDSRSNTRNPAGHGLHKNDRDPLRETRQNEYISFAV